MQLGCSVAVCCSVAFKLPHVPPALIFVSQLPRFNRFNFPCVLGDFECVIVHDARDFSRVLVQARFGCACCAVRSFVICAFARGLP